MVSKQNKKTCFIVSPIGPEGTETRKLADDFLELLIEPALEKYGFEVIRGDRIANSSAITSDIVRLVQESDLCVIDLTSSNPNVFYECGRRHETGRPFIQMVRKGDDQDLPFDVAGIRTVSYDLSSPRAVLESQKKLQDFIDALVATGFAAGTSGESLSSIAQSLERIERQLGSLLVSPQVSHQAHGGDEEDIDIKDLITTPTGAYIRALKKGQIDKALALLPRLEKASTKKEYFAALALLVSMGSARAYEIMDQHRESLLAEPAVEDREELITTLASSYGTYFINTGDFKTGIKVLEEFATAVLDNSNVSDRTRAFVVNRVGMVAWQGNDFAKCIEATEKALALSPDPSYAYNLGLVYDHQEMQPELAKTLAILSQMPDLDADHRRLLKKHGVSPKEPVS